MKTLIRCFPVILRDGRADDVREWLKDKWLLETDGTKKVVVQIVKEKEPKDLVLVAGGDGTLLAAVKKFAYLDVPFFGIGRGTENFLLNPIDSLAELVWVFERSHECVLIKTCLLDVQFFLNSGAVFETTAFNDVYFNAQPGTTIRGKIRGEPFSDLPELEFRGDGIIIATPQGSTAYNFAAGGSIVSLRRNSVAISTICCTRPIRTTVSYQKIEVEIMKGIATGTADGKSSSKKGIKKAIIQLSEKTVTLVFKPGYNFEAKRYR